MNASALPHLFQEELYQFRTQLVVVLSHAWESYTSEEQLLLKKILTSIKVDINAVQMVAALSLDQRSLHIYSPGKVLIFGSDIGETIDKYQQTSAQGFIVIQADDLNALDDQKKKNLWIALRQMFGV